MTRYPSGVAGPRFAAALLGLVLSAGSCAAREPTASDVVASIQPLALLLDELAGERWGVSSLVPPGASPHTFEPLPGDVARLARARSFVRAGAPLDGWTDALLAAAPEGIPTFTLLELEALDPLQHGHLHATAGAARDPHVWLDPILVRDVIAPALSRHLEALEPHPTDAYRERLAAFQARLTRLDSEIRRLLEPLQGRRYVAFHNAWRYFARRYGLEELGVVQEAAGEEPTPRELARLIGAARAARLPAILVEPQLDPRVARIVAAEFRGGTVVVDPMGSPDDESRSRYESLMRFNAAGFARACGGAAP